MNPIVAQGLIQGGAAVLDSVTNMFTSGRAADRARADKKWWALQGPGLIRKGAEDAGFNPLVFAGAQTYNPSPVAVGQSNLAGAAAAASDAIESRRATSSQRELAKLGQQNEAKRLALESKRLDDLNAQRKIENELAAARLHTLQTKMEAMGRNATALKNYQPRLKGKPWDRQSTGRQGGHMFGRYWEYPPGLTPAEDFMPMLGEFGEFLGGVSNTGATLGHNMAKDLNHIWRYMTNQGPPKGWKPPPKYKER